MWRTADAACRRSAAPTRDRGPRQRSSTPRATRRRGTAAAKSDAGNCGSARNTPRWTALGQRQVVVNARDRLHAAAVAIRQPHAVHALRSADVRGAVFARAGSCSSAASRHGMLPLHRSSSPIARYTTWWISVSSLMHASALAFTPVMSSTCDSLKSVVMCGCASAEPSAPGAASRPARRRAARAGFPFRCRGANRLGSHAEGCSGALRVAVRVRTARVSLHRMIGRAGQCKSFRISSVVRRSSCISSVILTIASSLLPRPSTLSRQAAQRRSASAGPGAGSTCAKSRI